MGIVLQFDQVKDTPWSPHFANLATLSSEPTKACGLALFAPRELPIAEANQKLDGLDSSARSLLWEGAVLSAQTVLQIQKQKTGVATLGRPTP